MLMSSSSGNRYFGRGSPFLHCYGGQRRREMDSYNWKGERITPETHPWCFAIGKDNKPFRRAEFSRALYWKLRQSRFPHYKEQMRPITARYNESERGRRRKRRWANERVPCPYGCVFKGSKKFKFDGLTTQCNLNHHFKGTSGYKKCPMKMIKPQQNLTLDTMWSASR